MLRVPHSGGIEDGAALHGHGDSFSKSCSASLTRCSTYQKGAGKILQFPTCVCAWFVFYAIYIIIICAMVQI